MATTNLRAYVGGIGVDTTEHDLQAAFALVGVELAHVELVVNPATGCLRGFAFVSVAGGTARACVNDVVARMRLAVIRDHGVTVHAIAAALVTRSVRSRTPTAPTGSESP